MIDNKIFKHEISKIDQIQANIFLQKIEEKFIKLEEEYNNSTGYKRNSIYQKIKPFKKYLQAKREIFCEHKE